MMLKRILLIFLILFFFLNGKAAREVELTKEGGDFIGGSYVDVYEDTSGSLPLNEIIKRNHLFKEEIGFSGATAKKTSNYWVRFKVKQNVLPDRQWLIEILDARQNLVELYEPKEDGTYKKSEIGFYKDFYSRDYTHKNFVFEIQPLHSNNQYYFLKFNAEVYTSTLFKIRTSKDFALYAINEYYLLGLYYGMLILMAIYSLFVFFTMREKVYLLYFLYVSAWMFNSMITDNIGFQYFWPNAPHLSKFGFYFARPLWVFVFVFYSLLFLYIKKDSKYRNHIFGALALYLAYYPVQLFIEIPFLNNVIFLLPFFIVYFVSIVRFKEGFRPARFFLLGNTFVLLSIIISILRGYGFLEKMLINETLIIISVYITNIALVLEIIILSFAMADRIRFIKDEKDNAKQQLIEQLNENQKLSQKVNKELAAKVKERTLQLEEQKKLLEEANEKLVEQSNKINKMNVSLDLDNWNLKKKIIEEKQSRITFKDISFEEFMHVYPNEVSCFSFLEELKWAEGFACIKCGNAKFGKGINKFSRRCTKCRYDETVTTSTIFYKCKFPINKALYIVVMVNRYGEDLSFTELSNKLELRNATCWAFAKKVLEVRNKSKYNALSDEHKLRFLVLNK